MKSRSLANSAAPRSVILSLTPAAEVGEEPVLPRVPVSMSSAPSSKTRRRLSRVIAGSRRRYCLRSLPVAVKVGDAVAHSCGPTSTRARTAASAASSASKAVLPAIRMSSAALPTMRSAPVPPIRMSRSLPPTSRSSPAPPTRTLLPPPPLRRSLPSPPYSQHGSRDAAGHLDVVVAGQAVDDDASRGLKRAHNRPVDLHGDALLGGIDDDRVVARGARHEECRAAGSQGSGPITTGPGRFKRPNIHTCSIDAGIRQAALICCQWQTGDRVNSQGVISRVDRRAAGQQGVSQSRAAIVGQWAEIRITRDRVGQSVTPVLNEIVTTS